MDCRTPNNDGGGLEVAGFCDAEASGCEPDVLVGVFSMFPVDADVDVDAGVFDPNVNLLLDAGESGVCDCSLRPGCGNGPKRLFDMTLVNPSRVSGGGEGNGRVKGLMLKKIERKEEELLEVGYVSTL